jgi:hypothetical protein
MSSPMKNDERVSRFKFSVSRIQNGRRDAQSMRNVDLESNPLKGDFFSAKNLQMAMVNIKL